MPIGLVVKNGSKILSSTSEGMPSPVSATSIATKSPASGASSSTALRAPIVTVPPSGMASRALITRLSSAVSRLGDVGADRPEVAADVEGQAHGAADAGIENLADRGDAFGEVDRLRIDALPPREGEELVGQRSAAPGGGLDGRDRALKLGRIVGASLQHVQAAADDHQEVVEVVRDPAGELSERVELLGLGELLVHRFELDLRIAAFGDVARDLGEPDELAVLVDRVDHDAGPEERAVLADAPTFLLVAALFPGDAERTGRLAVGAVGVGVEPGEMLAQDLLR